MILVAQLERSAKTKPLGCVTSTNGYEPLLSELQMRISEMWTVPACLGCLVDTNEYCLLVGGLLSSLQFCSDLSM